MIGIRFKKANAYDFQNLSLRVSTAGFLILLTVMILSAICDKEPNNTQVKEPTMKQEKETTKTLEKELNNTQVKEPTKVQDSEKNREANAFWLRVLQVLFLISFASVVLGHCLRIPKLLFVYIFFGVSSVASRDLRTLLKLGLGYLGLPRGVRIL